MNAEKLDWGAPWSSYLTRPLLVILLMGFASGLPLGLITTLSAWLYESHVNKAAIGLFAAVTFPYTLRFLWSPVMDGLSAPLLGWLGRRRGWIVLVQLALVGALLLMACSNPASMLWKTAMCAVLVAFLAASQDVVIDAYRVELLLPGTQWQGAVMSQLGYRLGVMMSSAGALLLAAAFSWFVSYVVTAALLGCAILVTLTAKEPIPFVSIPGIGLRTWLMNHVSAPFSDFMRHSSWQLILAFIVIYKLGDAFIGVMSSPFLLEIGFDNKAIAEIVRVYGTIATLLGTFLGGQLVARAGVVRVMFLAGLVHGATNVLYVVQADVGANIQLLAFATAVGNFSGGVSTAAFIAYLSILCNLSYTGTQYALLSSFSAVARNWFATPAGWIAKTLGWPMFFMLSALLALPGLTLLVVLEQRNSHTAKIRLSNL